ncbi:tRNA (uridine(54)-C5)-methyltransferase TrmA [Campylobacter ureolyticus]|uniref:tRNA m5U54 methyltransferase n=1 Tax=Campylobacter ureolyticus TaxID=827 RepID=A0AAE7EA69_9BACT|nr:tRNA (uridine(54)-C5)-methyltransferase TrmA [Campylobacter ureolyticus]MCR8684839.1 tRNA (uridine(54)-C5)-methyltransferase TrmA [Campylobacter ureolyticus]QKF84453.1 tRNA m5U54 methyltransferase [Campylobacter ureolyticus]QQY35388.1 tRNA (uridine(54)-C5)-methyltransferase TrmA [Campylobacter ureolyticus]SUX22681.1 tRNA (uracil-5-)-methyltransferase [Campylobacter ureolyticus]
MGFCKHLGECGSCTLNLPYDEQISYKKEFITELFKDVYSGEFKFFSSPKTGYRIRAEFGLYHEGNELFYTMNGLNERHLKINECKKVDGKISNLMPLLLNELKNSEKLKFKVFGVEFIATKNDILVILLYHRNILEIQNELSNLSQNLGVNLIARSRGKKLVFGSENLSESLFINGREFKYTFESSAFIQPNKNVNEKMITWALDVIENPKDLLEMYCGYGNFTIPLSFNFRQVLANEINKNAIKNALKNCELNGALNIEFLRMDSDDLMSAFKGVKFNRLKDVDLKAFEISHILVDPPRAGLSGKVINFIKNYENIIYISCNPLTLRQNLNELCKTHKVVNFAIFDQFPHTKHIECGVMLKKVK